jgi:hypothetical protein
MKVKLICGDDSTVVDFQVAENMLRIQREMRREGWVLPDDSPYEFKDNGLIRRTNKRVSRKESEKAADTDSD